MCLRFQELPFAQTPLPEQLLGQTRDFNKSRMFSPPLEVVLLKDESRDAVVTHSFFKVSKVAVTKSAFPIIYNDKFTTSKSNGKWKKRDVSIYIKFVPPEIKVVSLTFVR